MDKETKSPTQPEFIQNLFSDISSTYDKANNYMTFGLAHLWRKKLVNWSEAHEGQEVLDCATGTGDLAIEFKKIVGTTGTVLGTDFCSDMLKYAPQKAEKLNLKILFEHADATQLQYEDNRFDICSISYGIRNVSDTKLGLSEMARVTKPGGYVMILETGDNDTPVIREGLELYFQKVVPFVGGLISKNKQAYDYLNQSSRKFPSKESFVDLAKSTGQFSQVEYKTLLFGASYLYRCKVR